MLLGFALYVGPSPANPCVPLFPTYATSTVIVDVNWCWTVAFHISMAAGRCTVGRIRGSVLLSGPRNGIVPSAPTAGNGAGGGPVAEFIWYTGTLSLMLAELTSCALIAW